MEKVYLEAKVRNELGKEACGRLRRQGLIPAVVYGKDSVSLKLHESDFLKIIRTEAGENVVINLKVIKDGKSQKFTVIIKEIQYHPLREEILHVDFNQISLTETLTVNVPIVIRGEPIGVKESGGILEHSLWELEIECLPTQIPKDIEVEVSDLKIGDSVCVRDIKLPKGIKVLNTPELTVVSVKPPVVEKVEEVKPEEEITEPEVIKEKKEGEQPPEEE